MSDHEDSGNSDVNGRAEDKVPCGGMPSGAVRIGSNLAEFRYQIDRWGTVAGAYKEAADLVCSQCPDGDTSSNDLIFPMLYLYRHYLELSLKVLFELTNKVPGAAKEDIPGIHPLDCLYGKLSSRLAIVFTSTDGQPAREVSNALCTIEKWSKKFDEDAEDSGSDRFRYPVINSRKNRKHGSKENSYRLHPFPNLVQLLRVRTPSELKEAMEDVQEAIQVVQSWIWDEINRRYQNQEISK